MFGISLRKAPRTIDLTFVEPVLIHLDGEWCFVSELPGCTVVDTTEDKVTVRHGLNLMTFSFADLVGREPVQPITVQPAPTVDDLDATALLLERVRQVLLPCVDCGTACHGCLV